MKPRAIAIHDYVQAAVPEFTGWHVDPVSRRLVPHLKRETPETVAAFEAAMAEAQALFAVPDVPDSVVDDAARRQASALVPEVVLELLREAAKNPNASNKAWREAVANRPGQGRKP